MAGSLNPHYSKHEEKQSFLKIARLLIHEANVVLCKLYRNLTDTPFPSVHIPSKEQRSSPGLGTSTSIFILLRKNCGLPPPPNGWNRLPHDDDLSLSADITRIKCYRNEIAYESEKGAKLTEEKYHNFKEKIVSSLKRIVQDYSGTDLEAVKAWEERFGECLTSPITKEDEKNVEELKAWYLKDSGEGQQGPNLCIPIMCVGMIVIYVEPEHQLLVEGDQWKSSTNRTIDSSGYYTALGRKLVVSGHYLSTLTNFLHSLNYSQSVLLTASLQNNNGCALFLGNNNEEAKMALNQAIQTMNCTTQIKKDNDFIEKARKILFVLKNNDACVELKYGNFEAALVAFKNLYEEEKDEVVTDVELQRKNTPRIPVKNVENSSLSLNDNSAKQLNLVIVAMNYSQACLLSGKREDVVGVLQDVIRICQGCQLQLVVSARLARIFTMLGMKKQAKELVELHDIDCLKIQMVIENDSLKPFSVIYIDDICRMLAYNGKRLKAREFLETAIRVCKEMHSKQHPTVLSLEKTKEELFPTLVMEKACLSMEKDSITRLRVVVNVFVEYALHMVSSDGDREKLLNQFIALDSLSSDEKSFADVYTSEKQLASSTQSPTVAFISTIHLNAFLLQHVKSDSKAESYLQNQLTKIVSSCADPEENVKSDISFLSDDKSCCISSLCFLLETALLRSAHTSVSGICTSLVSCLSKGRDEDLNEVEYWYKDYCGLLSYFVATNQVQISGNKIPLHVIVASGSGVGIPTDVGLLPDEKALFKTIVLSAGESEGCSSDTSEANTKFFVFLRSRDLVDINDLRHINKTIVQSVQSLESSSNNANYQRSLFIEVGPEIDPANVSCLCIQLISLKCCFESSGTDCYGPASEPATQRLYLQYLQKTLSFKDEFDLDVFTVLLQYTFSTIGIVDVWHKVRKKMVCLMKAPPFSVLTLQIKENAMYLTLQEMGKKCFRDDNRGNDATQVIDDTIAECFEKLGISTNGRQDVWKRRSDEQTDDLPIFSDEEEDELEKALETNARLTAELEYLKSKQEKQTSRIKKLNDILSEMELRVGLLQHFRLDIFSNKDKMKAVENWITRKRARLVDPQEGPTIKADEVEEIMWSISNDELAELLGEIQRPDPMLTEDEAGGCSKEVSSNEDIKGAELHSLSNKERIFFEETKIEKSLDGEKHEDYIEGINRSSKRPSWYFPSLESNQDHSSLNIASEETQSPVLIEGYTQTDSLSLDQEYRDMTVQTDPVQQTNGEALEKGLADFRRDRAERQLRKSRLAQDVFAFKNRPRESSASLKESIVTGTSGYLSEGIPSYWRTHESLPEPSNASIIFQESSDGTEGASSDGTSLIETPQDSNTSDYLPDPWRSKTYLFSEASIHGTEGASSDGTPLDSTSSGSSEQLPSKYSITVTQESSDGTSLIETPQDSNTSDYLSDPWTSKSSVCSEASTHGTEGASSEESLLKLTTYNSSPEQLPYNCPTPSEEECHRKEGLPIEGTPQDPVKNHIVSKDVTETSEVDDIGNGENEMTGGKTSQSIARCAHLEIKEYDNCLAFAPGFICQNYRKVSKEENIEPLEAVDGRLALQEALNRPRADIFGPQLTDNRREWNYDIGDLTPDRSSCSVEAYCKSRKTEIDRGGVDKQKTQYHTNKKCYLIHEVSEGDKPSKGSSMSSETNSGDNERTRLLENVISDGSEHSTSNMRKQVRDDVTTHDRLKEDSVESSTDHSLGTSAVAVGAASRTVLGYVGSSNRKTHELDKSVTQCITGEVELQNSESSEEGHPTFRCSVQGNDSESHGENVGTKVENGQHTYPSSHLLCAVIDHKTCERISPLSLPYLQQGDENEASLSTIKETDDVGDTDTVWSSQGARPKRISPLHDYEQEEEDYIVSGVESSFLARHSKDSWLTRSVDSVRATRQSSFLSLPAYREKAEMPLIARTWPHYSEKQLPDKYDTSVLDDKFRPPYRGLPLDKRKQGVIFQDSDIHPKHVPLPGIHSHVATLPGRHIDVPTGTVPLPGRHSDVPTGTVPLPGRHSDVTTGTVPLPGRHSDVTKGTVPLPGRHSDVPTGTVPLPGSQSDVPTDTVPLPGSQSDVPTGTVPLPGSQSDVPSTISRTLSNGHHPHVEWQRSSSPYFNSKSSLNGINNVSPRQNTDDFSDDDDSYKTADNSFSSLDYLEDQIKRLTMNLSQMSASTMFGQDEKHDDEEDDDEDDYEEEEHRSNEMQTERRGQTVNNLEGTRETDLEDATSSSPREDYTRRDRRDVLTTDQTPADQVLLTPQRVPADVIDAKERELRLVREREREEQRKREEEEISRCLEKSQKAREQIPPSTPQPARLPVQESISEWPCGHYKRKCAIKFPCCEEFYYCHRCHNSSDKCPKDDNKALHGTHLRCLVCLTEQEITENSQYCINCNTELAEYFCGICKHFTGNEKKPYHCEPCGICRINKDKSFHCEVCNVCLDERLRNNHICRRDSGHDECCICLEDAFGGCQILPCSHKVHRDCAIAMLKNGIRKCPVCRHPLNQPLRR